MTWTDIDGMFAILIPVSLSPLIITLMWAERRVKRLDLVPGVPGATQSRVSRVRAGLLNGKRLVMEIDLVGLLLLGASVALILLPLTLANTAKGHWKNREFAVIFIFLLLTVFIASMIAMLVVGFVILPFFVLWNNKFSKFPVIPKRFFSNPSVMIASFIGMFDFVSVVKTQL
jgi:hypothetical protein